jgi:hypothetical protein
MNAFKNLIALLIFAMISSSAFAITNTDLFAYAEATYPSYFPGTSTVGQYLQYVYKLYSSGNYLAVDNNGTVSVLGPVFGNKILNVGTLNSFAPQVTAWQATQAAASGGGGTCTINSGVAGVNISICTAYPASTPNVAAVCNTLLPIYGGTGLGTSCASGYAVRCQQVGYGGAITKLYYYTSDASAARSACELSGGTVF